MSTAADNRTLTAIVTGASTGIGFAIARRFLEDGINVVMNARTASDLEAAHASLGSPDQAATVVGDIAEQSTGEALVRTAQSKFGGLDILVNNAGIFSAKPFLDTEESDLDRFYAINFKGAYFTSQAAIPAHQAARRRCHREYRHHSHPARHCRFSRIGSPGQQGGRCTA